MPTPKIRERLPERQSLDKRLRANILNNDLVVPFGPVGTSATRTHGLATPTAPIPPPRADKDRDSAWIR